MGRAVPDDAHALRYAPNVVRHAQRGTSTAASAMGRYVFHPVSYTHLTLPTKA